MQDDLKWEQWLEPRDGEGRWRGLIQPVVHSPRALWLLMFLFLHEVYSCSISGSNNRNLLQRSPSTSWAAIIQNNIFNIKHLQNNTQWTRWPGRGGLEQQSQIHLPFVRFSILPVHRDWTEEAAATGSLQQSPSLCSEVWETISFFKHLLKWFMQSGLNFQGLKK